MSRVIIITGHYGEPGDDVSKVADLTLTTKIEYAEKWDCQVFNYDTRQQWIDSLSAWGERQWNHMAFARLRQVQVAMDHELYMSRKAPAVPSAEYIIYMDADSAITNPEIDIAALLDAHDPLKRAHLFATFDCNHFHSGVMVFRVSQESLDILDAVWRADKSYDTGNWWEQGALYDECLRRGWDKSGKLYIMDKRILNSYDGETGWYDNHDWGPHGKEYYHWRPWSFILHTPAISYPQRYDLLKARIEEARQWREGLK